MKPTRQLSSERKAFNRLRRFFFLFWLHHLPVSLSLFLSCVFTFYSQTHVAFLSPNLRIFQSSTKISVLLPPETKTLKRLVRNIIDPSRDLGHVDRQKNSPPPSLNPAVTGEPSGSGAVLVQDQKSTQVTTTTPAVIIQVARQEDNNNNINDNEGIKSWGSEENEQEGLLPTETTVADGVLVPFLEKQQQQEREQDQKNENNRVFCQDCT